jgi:hypothetical protein
MYLGVLAVKGWETNAAATMAAVVESALTTRWNEEPNMANSKTGRKSVQSPVIAGVPIILA